MGDPLKFHLKVRHYEVDEYGHVNHANYVHYLEAARIEALERVGLPLPEMRRQGYLIVAVDLTVRYHAPARAGETLEITAQIAELRGARSVWIQEIHEVTTGRLVVTAEVTGAFMSEDGRPLRIPSIFHDKLLLLQTAPPPGATASAWKARIRPRRRTPETPALVAPIPDAGGPSVARVVRM